MSHPTFQAVLVYQDRFLEYLFLTALFLRHQHPVLVKTRVAAAVEIVLTAAVVDRGTRAAPLFQPFYW